jgi:hypothetical protein
LIEEEEEVVLVLVEEEDEEGRISTTLRTNLGSELGTTPPPPQSTWVEVDWLLLFDRNGILLHLSFSIQF